MIYLQRIYSITERRFFFTVRGLFSGARLFDQKPNMPYGYTETFGMEDAVTFVICLFIARFILHNILTYLMCQVGCRCGVFRKIWIVELQSARISRRFWSANFKNLYPFTTKIDQLLRLLTRIGDKKYYNLSYPLRVPIKSQTFLHESLTVWQTQENMQHVYAIWNKIPNTGIKLCVVYRQITC